VDSEAQSQSHSPSSSSNADALAEGTAKPVLVLGLGNSLRRDDGAGPAVIQRLGDTLTQGVVLVAHHGEATGLMQAWESSDKVILVDATHSGAAPGQVSRFDPTNKPLPPEMFPCSSHRLGLTEAVEMARALGRLPRQLVVYGIEGKAFGYGEGLTPAVANAVKQVARAVTAEVHGSC
jgi:hydrogenase maturation protease